MNRRLFLRHFMRLSVTAPFLVACGNNQTPLSSSPSPTSVASPPPTPTSFPKAADDESVVGLLNYYAQLLQLPMVYDSPDSLISALPSAESNVVRDVNNRMRRNGFTNFSQAIVYGTEDLHFYTVSFTDGLNACGAFFVRGVGEAAALLEGPAAVGFSNATYDFLQSGADVENTRGVFLPRRTEREALGRFDKPYSNPGRYNTAAGSVEVDYDTDGRGSGEISLISRNSEGGKLFEQVYSITYTL